MNSATAAKTLNFGGDTIARQSLLGENQKPLIVLGSVRSNIVH